MGVSRRDFIKQNAIAATVAASGIAAPVKVFGKEQGADKDIRWDKAPCRFCGTGCSVLVGTKDGKVIGTQGDPHAPVNKGLNCIKGYFLSKILYAADRLQTPMLRKKNGKYAKDGKFEPVSWDEAFDVMAEHWKAALKNDMATNKGKKPEEITSSVGMFGSGQWTIWEGYAAAKLFKAGFRSNNIDPNARHCMASAVGAFMRAFGIDEPMGCYDDLEHADAFVLWGSNMAEMHPILWSRLTDRRLTHDDAEVHVLSTYEHRCFELADNGMIFEPQTDTAILNYIANYIVSNKLYNKEFVEKHVNFNKTPTDIGYGLRPDHPLEKKKTGKGGKLTKISFEEYAKSLEPYTLEHVSKLTGVAPNRLKRLAKLYADPKKKVVSYWTMGMNQHTRGVWTNGLVYNVHLLMGKISEPGNGPFSLTGQPSACGTAREVGTFAHRLPADYVVKKKPHRDLAEKIWELPEGTIPGKVGYHAVLQNRKLKDGKLNAYWVMCNNNMQAGPNMNDEAYPGYRNPKNFIVVSDPYPTVTGQAADLILPTAMWVEKEGAYGNAERRSQFWREQTSPPGEAKSDLWQLMEFSKRFKVEEVWPAELIAQKPEVKGKTMYDVLYANGKTNSVAKQEIKDEAGNVYGNHESEHFGFYVQKSLFNEYRRFQFEGPKKGHEMAEFDDYHASRGIRWPVVDGKETLWRYRAGFDPHVTEEQGVHFYGKPDGRANIITAPYEPPPEVPSKEYPFWMTTGRLLEHWHTGTMTRRVTELYRAAPDAQVFMNTVDASRKGLKSGSTVKIKSPRGEITAMVETRGRNVMPPGMVFVPFFDAKKLVNKLILDATDPLSKETDFKKCPVSIEKIA